MRTNNLFSRRKRKSEEPQLPARNVTRHIIQRDVKPPILAVGLNLLPMEIILHICRYLKTPEIKRLNLVCRRLYRTTLSSLYRDEADNYSAESVFGWACDRGIAGTVELLVEFGFDVNGSICDAWTTPLKLAARRRKPDIVKLLISLGANVNSMEGQTTPLIEALLAYKPTGAHDEAHKSIESQTIPLIESPMDYNDTPTSSVHDEANKSIHTVRALLDNGADPDQGVLGTWLCTPLAVAMGSPGRDIRMVNLLLDYGAEVNPWEERPLYRAICLNDGNSEDKQIIHALLERGANPNAKGRIESCRRHPTPLARAVYDCHSWTENMNGTRSKSHCEDRLEIVDLLLAYGADINYVPVMERDNIIHRAIHPRQRIEVLHHLLERGADPNITNPVLSRTYGIWTPLHKAMWKKVPADRVALLLQYGASPLPEAPVDFLRNSNTTRAKVSPSSNSPLAMDPLPGLQTPHTMYFPLNTYSNPAKSNQSQTYFLNGATPLHQLLRNHISPITHLATGNWNPRRDWAKFVLLLSYAPSPAEILAPLTKGQQATLLSLSVSAARNERQLRRHLVNFARVTWLPLKDLLALCYEREFTGIWSPELSTIIPGGKAVLGVGAATGMEEIRYRQRDGEFHCRGLSKAILAETVLKDMCRYM